MGQVGCKVLFGKMDGYSYVHSQPVHTMSDKERDQFTTFVQKCFNMYNAYIPVSHTVYWIENDQCELIALASINHQEDIKHMPGRFPCIHNVCVDKKYRRQGLAKLLLRTILDDTEKRPVILFVDDDNASAINLYNQIGFEDATKEMGRQEPGTSTFKLR